MAIEEQTVEEIKQTMYLAVVGNGWEKAFSVYAAVVGAAGHSRSGQEFVVYKLEGTPAELAQTYVDQYCRFTYPNGLEIERDYARGTVSAETNWDDDDDYEKTTYIVRMYIGEE